MVGGSCIAKVNYEGVTAAYSNEVCHSSVCVLGEAVRRFGWGTYCLIKLVAIAQVDPDSPCALPALDPLSPIMRVFLLCKLFYDGGPSR